MEYSNEKALNFEENNNNNISFALDEMNKYQELEEDGC